MHKYHVGIFICTWGASVLAGGITSAHAFQNSAPLQPAGPSTPSNVKQAEDSGYYEIKMNGNLIGYANWTRTRINEGGQPLIRIDSRTMLKFSLLGETRVTELAFQTVYNPKTNRPIRYHSENRTNNVVTCIDCEFSEEQVRIWSYRRDDERGEPKELALDEGLVLLGGNNFLHWQGLLRAAAAGQQDGKATLNVLLPETQTSQAFELQRVGEAEDVIIAGSNRSAIHWKVQPVGATALADQKSGLLFRLEIPAQNTVIELSDASVVKRFEKAQAEELLSQLFVQSNVLFDDPLRVTELTAIIDVRVVGNDAEENTKPFNNSMQSFAGAIEDGRVRGRVTIRSQKLNVGESIPFPSEQDDSNRRWLAPATWIESDHAAIVKQSQTLTKNAKTRWEAVEAIGRWVHREIAYTIADTPSARLCLETRKGDCGPHSTLMIAMLRAANVPARLAGGLMYTPSFGGSFGQHAWVEVHMGDAGWIGVDPTSGEFERLSATHIKLFEGVGSVRPKSIEVESFQPPNANAQKAVFGDPSPLPWKPGASYTFLYKQGDSDLGTEVFSIDSREVDGAPAWEVTSELKLKLNFLTTLTSKTTLRVAKNGKPLSFSRKISALLQSTEIDCKFAEDRVTEKIRGAKRLDREVQIPANAFCFDNNLMACWSVICPQLKLKLGESLRVETFHPSSMQVLPLTFTPIKKESIEIGDEQIECLKCEIAPIKNTFWISEDGRFVRAQQGDLVIEVASLNPE